MIKKLQNCDKSTSYLNLQVSSLEVSFPKFAGKTNDIRHLAKTIVLALQQSFKSLNITFPNNLYRSVILNRHFYNIWIPYDTISCFVQHQIAKE